MNAFIKRIIEKKLGCRFYRNSLPRCVDLFYDIDKFFGISNYQVVFDIGANVGQSALKYGHAFPNAEIFSFEPVAETYKTLVKNSAGLKRIHPYHLAFGDHTYDDLISLNSDSTINSIVHNKIGKTERIRIETIDDFLTKNHIDVIDFMKTDTEGFELNVLHGAQTALKGHKIGLLSVECEPLKSGRSFTPFVEVAEYLREFDYELFGIYEQQLHWTGEKSILYFNPVFICKELVHQNATPDAYPLRPGSGTKR